MTQVEAFKTLTELLPVYNRGWQPDWNDNDYKYCITRCGNSIVTVLSRYDYHLIAFNNWQTRLRFMREQRTLINEVFGLT